MWLFTISEVHLLPFLKHRKEAAVSVPAVQHMGEASPLTQAARDLLQAIEAKDEKGVAAALQSAYDQCESAEEAPEPNTEDFTE